MAAKKKQPGRPPKPPRPGTVTAYIRNVDKEAYDLLHFYARRQNITVGEALSEIVNKALK